MTAQWTKAGVAAGVLMEGLDPVGCEGCREALTKNGYATVAIKRNPDGTADITPA